MRKIILLSILGCIGLVKSAMGQCTFPTYNNYGAICDEARYLCGYEMDGYTGYLEPQDTTLLQPFGVSCGNGRADNIQWFSFVADDPVVEIVIRYSNCTNFTSAIGVQAGIYENCDLDEEDDNRPLGALHCFESYDYDDIILKPDPNDIEVGQFYILFVDGYSGSQCDFEIDVISGICTDAPDVSEPCLPDCGVEELSSTTSSCTFFRDTFAFDPSQQIIADVFGCNPEVSNTRLDSIICVDWDIQPSAGVNFISSSFEYYDSVGVVPTVVVEWTMPGTYSIRPMLTFNPLFSNCQGMCDCTDDVVFTVEVEESVIVQLPDVELCEGECYDFCGQTYCEVGDYECRDMDACFIERVSIVNRPNVLIDNGVQYLCAGECYDFQNASYCMEGDYMISESPFCDTTFTFSIEELTLTADLIRADDLINCTISEAIIVGDWNTNFSGTIRSAWISENGDTLEFGPSYIALEDGVYTFVVWPENVSNCAVQLPHTVNKDDEVPTATVSSPQLDCNNTTDRIIVNSTVTFTSVSWVGPDGFSSTDLNPMVSQGGIYIGSLIAENECMLSLQTEVKTDFESPQLILDYEDLTCSEDIATATYTSETEMVFQSWLLPNGSTVIDDIIVLTETGNYSLEVTGQNGCIRTETFEVMDLSYDPSLGLNNDQIWRCNDESIELDLSAFEQPNVAYQWIDDKGAVQSNEINMKFTSPGTYVLISTDESVSCIGYDTVRITPDPSPLLDVELSSESPICNDGNDGYIEMISIDGGTAPYVYEVEGITYTDIEDIELSSGTYTVMVRDVYDCTVSKVVEVPTKDAFTLDVEEQIMIRFGQGTTLEFETSLDESEIADIEWSDQDGEVLGVNRELDLPGEPIEWVYLTVVDVHGCEVVTETKVEFSFEVDIYFPNVFSPNGDGNNDRFILYNNGFPEMADELRIFDRYGELIYQSSTVEFNETNVGWDGTFKGRPCQPGVYVFILEYTLMNGRRESKTGSITLVR